MSGQFSPRDRTLALVLTIAVGSALGVVGLIFLWGWFWGQIWGSSSGEPTPTATSTVVTTTPRLTIAPDARTANGTLKALTTAFDKIQPGMGWTSPNLPTNSPCRSRPDQNRSDITVIGMTLLNGYHWTAIQAEFLSITRVRLGASERPDEASDDRLVTVVGAGLAITLDATTNVVITARADC